MQGNQLGDLVSCAYTPIYEHMCICLKQNYRKHWNRNLSWEAQMWYFRDRGLQNQDFLIFLLMGSSPIWSLIGRPKNPSKSFQSEFFGVPRKWTPLFRTSLRRLWTKPRDVIFDYPCRRSALRQSQKTPEDFPRTAAPPKSEGPQAPSSAKL